MLSRVHLKYVQHVVINKLFNRNKRHALRRWAPAIVTSYRARPVYALKLQEFRIGAIPNYFQIALDVWAIAEREERIPYVHGS